MPYEVFLIAIMSPKWHAPILSKTNWYEFANSKTTKNKIIDPVWNFRYDMVVTPKSQQNRATAFDTHAQSYI